MKNINDSNLLSESCDLIAVTLVLNSLLNLPSYFQCKKAHHLGLIAKSKNLTNKKCITSNDEGGTLKHDRGIYYIGMCVRYGYVSYMFLVCYICSYDCVLKTPYFRHFLSNSNDPKTKFTSILKLNNPI